LYNPYVTKNSISPVSATSYSDRNSIFEHKITANDELYNIFTSYGWSWGGDWVGKKDYQHFEKNAD